MNQVKFVDKLLKSLKGFDLLKQTESLQIFKKLSSADQIPSNFLEKVFHKFYLVHSWIIGSVYLFAESLIAIPLFLPEYFIQLPHSIVTLSEGESN